MIRRSAVAGDREGERGQSVVELAFLLPVFLMLLLGMLELGLALDHLVSISYASREGARVGAALVNGGGTLGCTAGQSPNAATVDPLIIAAVERVLVSPRSLVELANVSEIHIYLATSTGAETAGKVNIWTYTPNTGPVVDGSTLDFSPPASPAWTVCSRSNTLPTSSIGISIAYRYAFSTPLGGVFALGGGAAPSGFAMSDRAIMAMNPTQ